MKKIVWGLALLVCAWIVFRLATYTPEYLDVDGHQFVLDGKVYEVSGNPLFLEGEYYQILAKPVR